VNSKISPPPAAVPETNRFWADAATQIRIAAPKHVILLSNRPGTSMTDLHFVLFSFVFIVAPLFCFVGLFFAFTEVLQEIRRDITRKLALPR
jgi:hypothetical protein